MRLAKLLAGPSRSAGFDGGIGALLLRSFRQRLPGRLPRPNREVRQFAQIVLSPWLRKTKQAIFGGSARDAICCITNGKISIFALTKFDLWNS